MRRVSLVLSWGLVLAVLAGCASMPVREPVSDVDLHRLQVMLDLPLIRDADVIYGQRPGTQLSPRLGWDRGAVSAGLFSADPAEGDIAVTPEQIRIKTANALTRLRETGWTIVSASCVAPEADAKPTPTSRQLNADPSHDHWVWNATAYSHINGVSYWTELLSAARSDGRGNVGIRVRAPNAADPPDMFADRPPGLREGSTCIEQPGVSLTFIEQGTWIELSVRKNPDEAATDPVRR